MPLFYVVLRCFLNNGFEFCVLPLTNHFSKYTLKPKFKVKFTNNLKFKLKIRKN